MANMPMPAPPLDGVPPSPPDTGGAQGFGQNPPIGMLTPQADISGNMQTVQLGLQTAAAIGKGLDLLGQIFPSFQPTAAMLQQQLRSSFKQALQQGMQASEPSAQAAQGGQAMPSPQATPGAVQNPLPPLDAGLGLG